MAILNGSLTINAKSTLAASGRAIYNGSVKINAISSLVASSKATLSGSVSIKSSSKLSIFWMQIDSHSSMSITNSVVWKLGSATFSGVSSFTAQLVKAASAFLRISSIDGEIITGTTLEGGGSEYMKTSQNIELASGDYFETDVNIFDAKGNPKDVSAYTFQWNMGGIVKTNLDGIDFIDAVNGKVRITLQNDDTFKYYGNYPHKLIMTDIQGHSTTVLKGIATIL